MRETIDEFKTTELLTLYKQLDSIADWFTFRNQDATDKDFNDMLKSILEMCLRNYKEIIEKPMTKKEITIIKETIKDTIKEQKEKQAVIEALGKTGYYLFSHIITVENKDYNKAFDYMLILRSELYETLHAQIVELPLQIEDNKLILGFDEYDLSKYYDGIPKVSVPKKKELLN
jgi:hypothetical protein